MSYTTIISTSELALHLDDPEWVIVDARFTLAEPELGWDDYQAAHIPGAVYAHLEKDLSGPVIPGETGRHPLPSAEKAAAVFKRLGIGEGGQVVAYDAAGGALAAVRVWWMLRWLGFRDVAVLDGSWQRWIAEGRPVRGGIETRPARICSPRPRSNLLVSTPQVMAMRLNPAWRVIDVRAPERYRGEVEPIDPVAGHIPGAINAPYANNLNPDGTFRSREELRALYQDILGPVPAEQAVLYCGSGVTSAHSVLAILHAGLGEARLYVGSWSEWVADPERPVAVGD